MNPLVNNIFVFSLGALLVGMGMFNCNRIRATLSDINHWVMNGDKEIVYPVALIVGFSLAFIASWLRWSLL